jgi:hypothetical protein
MVLQALALAAAVSPSPEPPSAQAFYSAAVAAMRELPQPRYLTYTMRGAGNGLDIDLTVRRHLVWLEMTNASSNDGGEPVTWWMRHRTEDYATEIATQDGRRLVSTRAFFDPTWYGAFRALREGMLFYQQVDRPVSASATPTPGPQSDLRTIAVVEVIGTNIYNVVDKGPARCSNGDAGHAMHLVPRDDNPRRQLTDVVVDLRNMRFCTIRFRGGDRLGFTGFVEQHYAEIHGYWLQSDGIVENAVRAFGIQVTHGTWNYTLRYTGFPSTIPAQAFVPSPYQ